MFCISFIIIFLSRMQIATDVYFEFAFINYFDDDAVYIKTVSKSYAIHDHRYINCIFYDLRRRFIYACCRFTILTVILLFAICLAFAHFECVYLCVFDVLCAVMLILMQLVIATMNTTFSCLRPCISIVFLVSYIYIVHI